MTFRLGLIGAGRMGRTHLRALTGSSVRVVAVADPAAAARAAFDMPGIAVHDTPEAMLDAGGLDGVLIATPTALHLPMVQLVAASGLPILCEKPCGLTARGAAEAARITDALGVRLQVAYWRRFVPALQRLRQRIADGALGELYLLACYQWDGAPPAAEFRVGSGGIFIDMGVHEFDQIRWLSGQDIADAHAAAAAAVGEAAVPGDSESAQALCRLSGGATAIVSLGRRFPLGDICKIEAFGTKHAEEAEIPVAARCRRGISGRPAPAGGRLRKLGKRRPAGRRKRRGCGGRAGSGGGRVGDDEAGRSAPA